ncbi:phosphoglycerate kinase [Candidatus Poribacteria bacterium]|nr:phosphoglycerate kinase [Candidatus Poribacteria bacterium]MYB65239.1 phosphoglycerate kinase [Candidatus Poribacteria bacterium]MYF55395.1 phosphoglycerate kinase [Candidatus Poribacteria bacterium]MYI93998.1 phosphoglycerate kinase [Candidatus Poribacteria bacterium]
MAKLELADIDVTGKRVLVRVDFNVPIQDGKITDETRITAALPTLLDLIHRNAKVILMTHLGRPIVGSATDRETFSTEPIAVALSRKLGKRVTHVNDCIGEIVENAVESLENGEMLLLENVRFYAEETDNDPVFAEKLSSLADVYVNDAFGTAHRAHASTEGVTHFLTPCVAGILMAREMHYLSMSLENPQRPYVAILGGAKISDKITLIENLLDKVDSLLIGGGMAYTFLAAMGVSVGNSLVETEKLDVAAALIKKRGFSDTVVLPADHVVGKTFEPETESKVVDEVSIPDEWQGLDIGPKTVAVFGERITNAKTVVWNGPLGVYEFEKFANGTIAVAQQIAASDSVSIIGGGDCVAAIQQAGVADRITHVSTGGGASLEFLEGKSLPGITALTDKS